MPKTEVSPNINLLTRWEKSIQGGSMHSIHILTHTSRKLYASPEAPRRCIHLLTFVNSIALGGAITCSTSTPFSSELQDIWAEFHILFTTLELGNIFRQAHQYLTYCYSIFRYHPKFFEAVSKLTVPRLLWDRCSPRYSEGTSYTARWIINCTHSCLKWGCKVT